MQLENLTGRRYTHLLVVGRGERRGRHTRWDVICDCGRTKNVSGPNLRNGRTLSCGNPICRYNSALRVQARLDANGSHDAGVRQVWNLYRFKARRKRLEFTIEVAEFESLLFRPCHYCGGAPSNMARRDSSAGGVLYNGIDRIDSAKGYTTGNMVPCCGICNTMKNTLSPERFLEHVRKILEHQPPADDLVTP